MVVVLSVVVGVSDTDSDYNDPESLDNPIVTSNGVSSVTNHAMNSSAAINDNFLNAQRQQHQDGCVSLYVIIIRSTYVSPDTSLADGLL